MSSPDVIDLCSDGEIGETHGKDVGKEHKSFAAKFSLKRKYRFKEVQLLKSVKQLVRQESVDDTGSNRTSSVHSKSTLLGTGGSLDESSLSSASPLCPTLITRQFWKAGEYECGQAFKAETQNGKNHLCIHPMFLHSNATSHKWVFGAIAELVDNAVDEIQNGATFVAIDKYLNPRDGSPTLVIQDDGRGMDPETIRRCMSFGYSDKKLKVAIGQYGNGFKTSSMRLGADVIVFTRHMKKRTLTQSIGLLSYTFLRQASQDRIVVPMVDYEVSLVGGTCKVILPHGKDTFSSNLSTLLQWSPYLTEEELLKQFDDIGNHGTKVVVYNLWLKDDGTAELDFDSIHEDIRISGDSGFFKASSKSDPIKDRHVANMYRYSFRAYLSVLYLRIPESFKVILRGQIVEHQNIATGLIYPEVVLYKPHGANVEMKVITTIGFWRDTPNVNFHGFSIYHRNRLIMPFWPVLKVTSITGKGIAGVLEANFIEPTHNKQDFEKTSLFQKLEYRLKEMTIEYWHLHCSLIGYAQRQNTYQGKPVNRPLKDLPSRTPGFHEPVYLNRTFHGSKSPEIVPVEDGSFQDSVPTPSPDSAKRARRLSVKDDQMISSKGLNLKRKKHAPAFEINCSEPRIGVAQRGTENRLQDAFHGCNGPEIAPLEDGSFQDSVPTPFPDSTKSTRPSVNDDHSEGFNLKRKKHARAAEINPSGPRIGAPQPDSGTENPIMTLLRENKRLQSQWSELEIRKNVLNLKVQHLTYELEAVQRAYTKLLDESKSLQHN